MSAGTLWCVGVGPGDPELITIKAARILRESAVIAVPVTNGKAHAAYDIALRAVPEIAGKERLLLDFPMRLSREGAEAAYDDAAGRIAQILSAGRDAALVTLGDPSIYSTAAHVHRRMLARGLPAFFVPGVPSFCAAAARLNEPLVSGRTPLFVSSAAGGALETLNASGTKVYLKPASALRETIQALRAAGKDARLVQNCGMENERVYASLSDAVPEESYYSILIVKDETNP